MKHVICNLFSQPVTLTEVNVEGIADFFENTIKPNVKGCSEGKSQIHLTNYHNTENIFELYDELKPLGQEILSACNFVYQEILNYDSDLRFTNAWINESEVGGEQGLHNHCNSALSGTVYLRTDENTNIEFPNRFTTSDTVCQLTDDPNQERENKFGHYYHKDTATFTVQTGYCMIWPSYLKHGYSENKTPRRLSLSFNTLPNHLNCLYKL